MSFFSWLSQKAMFSTFVSNHEIYTKIRDETSMADEIKHLVDNRLLLHEAKNLTAQLEEVEEAMNTLQVTSFFIIHKQIQAYSK